MWGDGVVDVAEDAEDADCVGDVERVEAVVDAGDWTWRVLRYVGCCRWC